MTRWAVVFRDTADMMQVRANQSSRDAHVAYVKAHPELLIGGGLKPDPNKDFCGALWIVEAETRQEVENLIKNDPFYVAKYRSYEVFSWGKIIEDQIVTL